jgi:hypothetical protein
MQQAAVAVGWEAWGRASSAGAVEDAVVADSDVGQIHGSAAVPDSARALLAGVVAQIAGVVWLEGDWAGLGTMER